MNAEEALAAIAERVGLPTDEPVEHIVSWVGKTVSARDMNARTIERRTRALADAAHSNRATTFPALIGRVVALRETVGRLAAEVSDGRAGFPPEPALDGTRVTARTDGWADGTVWERMACESALPPKATRRWRCIEIAEFAGDLVPSGRWRTWTDVLAQSLSGAQLRAHLDIEAPSASEATSVSGLFVVLLVLMGLACLAAAYAVADMAGKRDEIAKGPDREP